MDSCSLDDSPPVSIDSSVHNNNSTASTATTKTTIAQRRRIPATPDKLRLYAQWSHSESQTTTAAEASDNPILNQLEEENALLPPQDSENDLLEHIERQQGLLHLDPKPSCLDSLDASSIDDPFWKSLVENYAETATRLPRMLITELRRRPVPQRGLVWQAMAHSADTHLAAMYDRLVQGEMGISSYERVIDRDVARMTMGQETARLLKAYSVYDAHVGYSQGLAVLARPLLMVMDEKAAFCTFVRLMETYEMRSLFTLNMEGLHLRLHQFETLVAQICPRLHDHLAENSIRPAMYASQWFLTLFTSSFPTPLVLRMYDLVFAQGAILTAMRVAVAIMQKLEDRLLQIHQFEQLLTCLTNGTLYDDEADLIETVFELSSVITYPKLDSVAETHHKELQQEQKRAQQLVALRLSNRKSKRESWFSWKQAPTSPPTSPTATLQQQRQRRPSINQDRAAVSVLHQQIEDLVMALSQLQKEHSRLHETVTSMHLKQLDHEAERDKLLKRNATLEKKVKKYKAKLINLEKNNPPPTAPNDAHFKEFVDSLRMSGDFGALVAGALATTGERPLSDPSSKKRRSSQVSSSSVSTAASSSNRDSENDTVATVVDDVVVADDTTQRKQSQQHHHNCQNDDEKTTQSMHQITSELVSVKLANFEMGQKYEQLCKKYGESQRQLSVVQDERDSLARQLADLQVELEAVRSDKEIVLQEHEEILRENEELAEKAMASKRTASELQFEKMALVKDVQELEKRVQTLEKEKQEYLLPRGTFSEEVFAAHRILFDEHRQQQSNKRHTLATAAADKSTLELQSKYVESDLRCRELEKLLAEAKVKIAEYEALTSMPISPRASMIQMKRMSTASLSILAGASRVTSPTDYSHHRDSTESFASSITSATSLGSAPIQKRSSMYARLWTPRNSLAKQPEEVS